MKCRVFVQTEGTPNRTGRIKKLQMFTRFGHPFGQPDFYMSDATKVVPSETTATCIHLLVVYFGIHGFLEARGVFSVIIHVCMLKLCVLF